MKNRNMTTAMIRTAAILIFAVGSMTSAVFAQNKDDARFRPVAYYTGVESAAGTLEPTTGSLYGNTVVLNHFNEGTTQCLSISVDYSTLQFVPDSFIVTGGSWSLVVIRNGIYVGTIYGDIPSGSVLVSTNSNGDSVQLTQANLRSTGGLGEFAGKAFKGLNGVVSSTVEMRTNQAKADVAIDF